MMQRPRRSCQWQLISALIALGCSGAPCEHGTSVGVYPRQRGGLSGLYVLTFVYAGGSYATTSCDTDSKRCANTDDLRCVCSAVSIQCVLPFSETVRVRVEKGGVVVLDRSGTTPKQECEANQFFFTL